MSHQRPKYRRKGRPVAAQPAGDFLMERLEAIGFGNLRRIARLRSYVSRPETRQVIERMRKIADGAQ